MTRPVSARQGSLALKCRAGALRSSCDWSACELLSTPVQCLRDGRALHQLLSPWSSSAASLLSCLPSALLPRTCLLPLQRSQRRCATVHAALDDLALCAGCTQAACCRGCRPRPALEQFAACHARPPGSPQPVHFRPAAALTPQRAATAAATAAAATAQRQEPPGRSGCGWCKRH